MIGIDILEVSRIEEKIKKNPNFITNFLNQNEINYVSKFKNKIERITGFFCAKEAVMKSLGCPKELSFKKIEICHEKSAKSFVVFSQDLPNEIKQKKIEISISHSKTVAVAVAICF